MPATTEVKVHYWKRFIPSMGWTLTKCGALVTYGASSRIVMWAEKEATCEWCLGREDA